MPVPKQMAKSSEAARPMGKTPRPAARAPETPLERIRQLQSTVGNQVVLRMMRSNARSPHPSSSRDESFDAILNPLERGRAQVAPPIVHDVIRGGGQPLDKTTRSEMESLLGRKFDDVRIHTDAHAALSARAIDARAYTVGNHIAFSGGEYAPAT